MSSFVPGSDKLHFSASKAKYTGIVPKTKSDPWNTIIAAHKAERERNQVTRDYQTHQVKQAIDRERRNQASQLRHLGTIPNARGDVPAAFADPKPPSAFTRLFRKMPAAPGTQFDRFSQNWEPEVRGKNLVTQAVLPYPSYFQVLIPAMQCGRYDLEDMDWNLEYEEAKTRVKDFIEYHEKLAEASQDVHCKAWHQGMVRASKATRKQWLKNEEDYEGIEGYASCILALVYLKMEWECLQSTEYRVGSYNLRGCPNLDCEGHFKDKNGNEYPDKPAQINHVLSDIFVVKNKLLVVKELELLQSKFPEFKNREVRTPKAMAALLKLFGNLLDPAGAVAKGRTWGAQAGTYTGDKHKYFKRVVTLQMNNTQGTKVALSKYVTQFNQEGVYLEGFDYTVGDETELYTKVKDCVTTYTPYPDFDISDLGPKAEKVEFWKALNKRKWWAPVTEQRVRAKFPTLEIFDKCCLNQPPPDIPTTPAPHPDYEFAAKVLHALGKTFKKDRGTSGTPTPSLTSAKPRQGRSNTLLASELESGEANKLLPSIETGAVGVEFADEGRRKRKRPELGWVKEFQAQIKEPYSGNIAKQQRDFFGLKYGETRGVRLPDLHQQDFPPPTEQEMSVWSTAYNPDKISLAKDAYEEALNYQDLYHKVQYLARKVPTINMNSLIHQGREIPMERSMDKVWKNGIEEGHPDHYVYTKDSMGPSRHAMSPVVLVKGIPTIVLAAVYLVRFPAATYLANVIGRAKCHKQNYLDAKAHCIELEKREAQDRRRAARMALMLQREGEAKAKKAEAETKMVKPQPARSPSPEYQEIPEYTDALKPTTLESMESYRLQHHPAVGKRLWRKFTGGDQVVAAFKKPLMIRKKKIGDLLAQYLVDNPVEEASESAQPDEPNQEKLPQLPEGVTWFNDLSKTQVDSYQTEMNYWFVNAQSRSIAMLVKVCEGFLAYPVKQNPTLNAKEYAAIAANTLLAYRPAVLVADSDTVIEEEVTHMLERIHEELNGEGTTLTWEDPRPSWLEDLIKTLDTPPNPFPPTPDESQVNEEENTPRWTPENLVRFGFKFSHYGEKAEKPGEEDPYVPIPGVDEIEEVAIHPYSIHLGDISDYEYNLSDDRYDTDTTDNGEDSDFHTFRNGLEEKHKTGTSDHSSDEDAGGFEGSSSALRNLDLGTEDLQYLFRDPKFMLFHKNLAVVYNALKNGNIPNFSTKLDKYSIRLPLRKLLTIMKIQTRAQYSQDESVRANALRIIKGIWKYLNIEVKDMTLGVWAYTFYLWVQVAVIRLHAKLPDTHGNHVDPTMWRCQVFAAVYQQYGPAVQKILGKDAVVSNPLEEDCAPKGLYDESGRMEGITHFKVVASLDDKGTKDQKENTSQKRAPGEAGGELSGDDARPAKKAKVETEKRDLVKAIRGGTASKTGGPKDGQKVSAILPAQSAIPPHTLKRREQGDTTTDLDLGNDEDVLRDIGVELDDGVPSSSANTLN